MRQLETGKICRHRRETLVRRDAIAHVTKNVYQVMDLEKWWNQHRSVDPIEWGRKRSAWMGLLSVEGSVATGAAALALHGVWGLPMRIAPEIALNGLAGSRGARGVRVRQFAERFPVTRYQGRMIAAPEAALAQAMPELGFRRAVAVVDSALNKEIIPPGAIPEIHGRMRGRRGVRGLGNWWEHVDARSQSPMETFARLDCAEAGIPPTELQVEIHEGGEFIARADLGWRKDDGAWVLVEIDGRRFHESPEALFHDRERQNRIMLNGRFVVLRFTGRDVMQGRVAPAVARALRT